MASPQLIKHHVAAPKFPHHGNHLRGLTAGANPGFEGRFGRLFPLDEVPSAKYGKTDGEGRAALMKLGAAMTSAFDPPKDGSDPEESGIPALYTYFGQFVDHDITFDPSSVLMHRSDPNALVDFRSPAFDLDNVYGRGPTDQPYLYDDGPRFLLGGDLDNGGRDLPRNNATPRRALIGDPRNDENTIVSQLQGLFLRFHNRTVRDHPELEFFALQTIVRFHYQWLLLHDFLPRIVHSSVLRELKTAGKFDAAKLKFFRPKNGPFMPIEFSAAAYRLGHSMIRPGYRLNDDDRTLLPIFPIPAGAIKGIREGIPDGLTGFRAMDPIRGIDWGRFIDIERRSYGTANPKDPATKRRLQYAYRIDTSIATPLAVLPAIVAADPPPSLPQRNLIRGFELGLPSGQDVARYMGIDPLKDREIEIGKAVDRPQKGDIRGSIASIPALAPFKGKCPLWTYILAEAFQNRETVTLPVTEEKKISTPRLGPVGGRIVTEVFLGLLFADKNSYLNLEPVWRPRPESDYRLADFVKYAVGL